MRILFFGYSQLGHRAVELLAALGDEVVAVVTHRDDPAEQRWYRTPAEAARRLGLPVLYSEDLASPADLPPPGPSRLAGSPACGASGTPQSRKAARLAALAEEARPDLVLSVFYREMLPRPVLAGARLAALNLHPSLLPAYRGRAPINWVLVEGEKETGVTLHHMVSRADAGDIVAQRAVPITPRETALSLYHKVEEAGVELLAEMLPRLADGTAPRRPQDETHASTFGRRRPEDGRIDWAWPAHRIDCLVRAVAPPWPGAFADLDGRCVQVHEGVPAEPLQAGARPAPGTLRRDAGRLLVATGDRWFHITAGAGLDLPVLPLSTPFLPTPGALR